MDLNRASPRDLVKEVICDALLAEEENKRENNQKDYKISIAKTKHLHANLLFTDFGHSVLKPICGLVTCIEPNGQNTSWKDLAARLGYSDVSVKCVTHLEGKLFDPTEQVLEFYATTDGATVGEVLQALLDLKLLSALHQAHLHIDSFLADVETNKEKLVETSIKTEEPENKVVKVANFTRDVPAIFGIVPAKKASFTTTDFHNGREEERVQKARPKTEPKKHKEYCKRVMLSFADDGHMTAIKVANVFRATKNKNGLPIGVMMLYEHEETILMNPVQMIPDILSQMDFVVPILSEGYFAALKQPNPSARLVDERYVQFIHDTLLSRYIHNSCRNMQVRPVIPSHTVRDICRRPEFINESMLNAWKSDDDISALAINIVKAHKIKT